MKKKFYKSLWFWLIVAGVLLLVANILVLVLVKDIWQSAWLTLISGWVSGIATIILGLIAVAQNKKYTLLATKMEIKESVHEEQLKIAELSDYVVRYSVLKKPLNILVANNVSQKDLLSYNLEIDAIREQLLMVAHNIQLLKFVPNTMILLVEKTIELIKYTYEDFQTVKDHCNNDNLLSNDIKKISRYISSWAISYIELCQQAMKELLDLVQIVNDSNSVDKLKTILQNVEQKVLSAQKDIVKLLDREQNKG